MSTHVTPVYQITQATSTRNFRAGAGPTESSTIHKCPAFIPSCETISSVLGIPLRTTWRPAFLRVSSSSKFQIPTDNLISVYSNNQQSHFHPLIGHGGSCNIRFPIAVYSLSFFRSFNLFDQDVYLDIYQS